VPKKHGPGFADPELKQRAAEGRARYWEKYYAAKAAGKPLKKQTRKEKGIDRRRRNREERRKIAALLPKKPARAKTIPSPIKKILSSPHMDILDKVPTEKEENAAEKFLQQINNDPEELSRVLAALQEGEEQIERKEYGRIVFLNDYIQSHQIEFFRPYSYQQATMEAFREGFLIVINPVSNKVGKSYTGAALVHSWAKGYEPWNPVPDTFKGAVRIGDKFFMPSSLGIKPPVDIIITGEDWEEHAGKVLVPILKRFAVGANNSKDGEWETSKNNVGIETDWKHKPTGSTFALRTYRQDKDLFESFKATAWWADEPPPKPIWVGMSRGLFMTGGRVFMSMTPLKEAWIFDELILAQRADVKVIANISLWDAPHLYDNDMNVLMKAGLTDEQAKSILVVQKQEARQTKNLPETEKLIKDWVGNKTVTFVNEFGQEFIQDALVYVLQKLQIHRFIKELEDDSERIPRVFGEPKHLMGRCWKHFVLDVHRVKDFSVPTDWPVDVQIDFHPNENIAISFRAVDPWGRNFIVDEVWDHLRNSEIVDNIVRRWKRESWRLEEWIEIDALAKGDSSYAKNRFGQSEDSFDEIQRLLKKYKLKLRSGSKAEKNYIAKVDEWMTHEPPLFFVQAHCTETIKQIERWVYEDNGKPSDGGHFPECIGRFSQTGLKYHDLEEDKGDQYQELIARLDAPLSVPME
jgi:hypothetical protein